MAHGKVCAAGGWTDLGSQMDSQSIWRYAPSGGHAVTRHWHAIHPQELCVSLNKLAPLGRKTQVHLKVGEGMVGKNSHLIL